MKASEGTGATAEPLVRVPVPGPWNMSPLREGQKLGRKHLACSQADGQCCLQTLTSGVCCKGTRGLVQGPWGGTRVPKHMLEADGDVAKEATTWILSALVSSWSSCPWSQ